LIGTRTDFAIKPSRGSGGRGILIVSSRTEEHYRKINGLLISRAELKFHLSNILSGMYSLGGQPDKVIIEYRVKFDPVFETVSYQGVPDIRIILFLGVPVMAMVRLPTRLSDGKANLHQGAIGAGIDMREGTTLTAVWRNNIITEHPDTGNSISRIKLPNWKTLLNLAARCYEMTGLGYQGVDIVLDRNKVPMNLELNAKPGLNIQIANRAGLLPRLKKVEAQGKNLKSITERVDFSREHFSA
jgi:alpha-L-glutamate ligase-like protein